MNFVFAGERYRTFTGRASRLDVVGRTEDVLSFDNIHFNCANFDGRNNHWSVEYVGRVRGPRVGQGGFVNLKNALTGHRNLTS